MELRLDLPATCVVAEPCLLGESPVWSARESALYWVDITAPRIHRWDPASGVRQHWPMPAAVGSIGLRERGGMVVALRSGFHLFDPRSGALTFLENPEPYVPTNRLNDGKVSPEGRFWAGTMDDRPERAPTGSLYRLDADHRCTHVVEGIRVSNGLAWSPDGRTLYRSDSRGAAIFRHAYDPDSGALGAQETFVAMRPEWGRPDGAAVDVEGCYWSCGIGMGRINRFDPDGRLVSYIALPVTHPTMPCFAGPDLKTLYVTSLREGLAAPELERTPLAGALFRIEMEVAGTPVALYRG